MDRYTEIQSFVLTAEEGSFAAAALVEGVTPAVMGRRLTALEERLGVQLMHRSTRGLTLTDIGWTYLKQCRQLVQDLAAADASIMAKGHSLMGRLAIAAPASFGRLHVAPHAIAFRLRHPELAMSFNFADRLVDLVHDGYDMAVRIGGPADPSQVSIPLYPNRRVVCGTPEYFKRHGIPREPEDLAGHNCLTFNLHGGQHRGWLFMRDGKPFAVRVKGTLTANDGELLYRWACAGLGLAWRSTWEIQRELKAGTLMTVLDAFEVPDYDIRAIYPDQRYLPPKVRYFIDYLKACYHAPGYWDEQVSAAGAGPASPVTGA